MGFDGVRLAVQDVYAATVSPPSRHARGEMFVGVGAAALVLVFVFVLLAVRVRVANVPKMFDEGGALLVVGQLLERIPLRVGDDVGNFVVQPFLVRALGLARQFLFLGQRTRQR